MSEISEEYASLALKRFYDTATDNIQTSAIVNRALADKISTETINQKVSNQFNSIYTSMKRINPKFNETSKNYRSVKQDILDVLTDYEMALTEYSDYYDKKLEDLILEKVELESSLVGKVFKEENLKNDEKKRKNLRENDSLKINFSEKAKNAASFVSEKKKTTLKIDFTDIRLLSELEDLKSEQEDRLDKKISKIQEIDKSNNIEIKKIEDKIKDVEKEIKEINEKKKLGIENAMETKDKWISVTIRKPSVWSKTKNFFLNKFNTSKVVSKTVIAPLKMKVNEFRVNELEELKG